MISDPLLLGLIMMIIMFSLLFMGLWIGFSLMATGIIGMLLYNSSLPPFVSIWSKIGSFMSTSIYNSMNSWALAALPLFIFVGEILYRTKLSDRLLDGLTPWVINIPGRLFHINVAACSLFAAVSGSSAATTATIGKITLNELLKRGYNRRLAIGSLAGAGTLGFLIPPSLIMIIYGVLSNTSIGRLFIGGIIPGIILAGSFSGFIAIKSIVNPELVPPSDEHYTFREKMRASYELIPIVALILVILGSIYAGFATPTESAAIGVVGSLMVAWGFKNLSWSVFIDALLNTVKTTAMICFIIFSAAFLSQIIGFIGIATAVSEFIASLHMSPYLLIAVIGFMYIILGMFLDGISMVVMTLPIVLPIVIRAGFSPLWFGIYLVFMTELAQITPPVGFNIFVIQGISDAQVGEIVTAAFPFFLIMVLNVVLITLFPHIVSFLPSKMIVK